MLEILARDRIRTAYLKNAYEVNEDNPINDIGTLQFKLPCVDPKTQYCKPFHLARWIAEDGDKGELYRIIKTTTDRDSMKNRTYMCEHVLATLADSVMPGYHVIGNIGVYTVDVINYVLSFQKTPNWVLDECDFSRQFEYGWSNETVLNALWSIPNRFTDPYIWTVNTSVYPWRISLKRIDVNAAPRFFVRGGHNLLSLQSPDNAQGIITRLYALGYGEGDNQLTIKSVNNGIEYLQSPDRIIEEYGIVERYLVDRRFEDAQSLKERAQVVLDAMQEPQMSATVSVSDIYQKTHNDADKIENGRIVMIVDEENPDDSIKSYVTSVTCNHDQKGEARITIANKPTDIASSLVDLADKQRIETVYSQGATQLYAQSVQANASTTKGAILRFFIPLDMRIVNFVNAKITLDHFRSYSKATGGGGESTQTSSSGGASTQTSSSGGGSTQTTSTDSEKSTSSSSGGGYVATTDMTEAITSAPQNNWGDYVDRIDSVSGGMVNSGGSSVEVYTTYVDASGSHRHRVLNHSHSYCAMPMHRHGMGNHRHAMVHQHSFTLSSHKHTVTIPSHAHTVNVPAHSHSVNIPSHTHTVRIPDHTHDITQGIFEFGNPTSAAIYVNGTHKGTMGRDAEMDISAYLINEQNLLPRGSWLSVEVRPDDLAYVTIDLVIKGFCQSRGGSTY